MRRTSLILALALGACGSAPANPPPTVSSVDLSRYVGVWYEAARYENDFQDANCLNVTATYAVKADGDISVLNKCRDAAGTETESAEGSAYIADTTTNAKLRVTFFWPFYGDYWIVALADDYSWVIVSEPNREYFWILTREPLMPGAALDGLVDRAVSLGFDKAKMKFTRTEP